MYAAIDQFTHFLVISFEYGEVTYLSSGEGFRVYEQPKVISSDQDRLIFSIFKIEYGSGFASHDYTWMPMSTTSHGSRVSPYRHVSMEF
jgi:hypothetical protein